MTRQVYNIFPTTIYVNQIENHKEYKSRFYKLYSKYDYEQTSLRDNEEWFNTTSENFSKPYIHLEEDLCELFEQIIDNVKIYVQDVLKYQDIFNFIITKLGYQDQEILTRMSSGIVTLQVIYPFHTILTHHLILIFLNLQIPVITMDYLQV